MQKDDLIQLLKRSAQSKDLNDLHLATQQIDAHLVGLDESNQLALLNEIHSELARLPNSQSRDTIMHCIQSLIGHAKERLEEIASRGKGRG